VRKPEQGTQPKLYYIAVSYTHLPAKERTWRLR